ncbi:hypothetical protein HYQ46_008372 [Verticillium longisporum]|nr:hypothetical protein HYQ46_008372 [Verticillium longisporum]
MDIGTRVDQCKKNLSDLFALEEGSCGGAPRHIECNLPGRLAIKDLMRVSPVVEKEFHYPGRASASQEPPGWISAAGNVQQWPPRHLQHCWPQTSQLGLQVEEQVLLDSKRKKSQDLDIRLIDSHSSVVAVNREVIRPVRRVDK